MKLNKWFYGAMALGMLAACSEDNIAPDYIGDNKGEGGGISATGYLAVEIKLPQESASTRAEENDQFADGTPEEYKVNDARIILFKGTKDGSEMNAKFYRSQVLKKPFFDNLPTDDQITSSYLAAIEVKTTPESNDNFWAMVLINTGDRLGIVDGTDTNADNSTSNTITIDGHKFTEASTFRDFLNTTITCDIFDGSHENGYSNFLMANAPLSTAKGGTYDIADKANLKADNIFYLTNLGSSVYPTMEEAKNNVAGCVYVERVASKVTAKLGENPFQIKIYSGKRGEDGNPTDVTDQYEISATVKYTLTNTNNVSYLVRNVDFSTSPHFKWDLTTTNKDGNLDYRMVGSKLMPGLNSPFHGQTAPVYRTYWCKDPNYSTAMQAAEKTVITNANNLAEISKALYCRENTFEVQHQNHGNSTLAVFEVDFTVTKKNGTEAAHNLFIKDGNTKVIYATKEDAMADEITRIVNDPMIAAALRQSVKAGVANDTEIKNAETYLKFDISREVDEDGKTTQNLIMKDITLEVKNADDPYFDANSKAKFDAYLAEDNRKTDLLTKVNLLNEITEYTGGKSYYVIPVSHFGDFYCPWNGSGVKTEDAYNDGYSWTNASEEHANKYLGRYGMVRNNWYELNINAIKSLGSPTFPEINLTLSDDNKEEKQYFAVEIHILSWAKRTQNATFE